MQEFFRAYYQQLQTIHDEIATVIDELPQEALDWRPSAAMNSVAVLAAHTAGAERYWIGDVAGADHAPRVRSEEFETRGQGAEELQQRLAAVLAHSHDVLQTLTVDELPELRHSWRDEKRYSVAWALVHALEHSAMHLGHMQIIRDLWQASNQERT